VQIKNREHSSVKHIPLRAKESERQTGGEIKGFYLAAETGRNM